MITVIAVICLARGIVFDKVRLKESIITPRTSQRSRACNFIKKAEPATLLKKRLWHRCFPVNFAKFLRTPFLQNSSGRLLLALDNNAVPARETKDKGFHIVNMNKYNRVETYRNVSRNILHDTL